MQQQTTKSIMLANGIGSCLRRTAQAVTKPLLSIDDKSRGYCQRSTLRQANIGHFVDRFIAVERPPEGSKLA